MVRTLLCLPVCLLLAPSYPGAGLPESSPPTTHVEADQTATKNGLPDPAKDVLGYLAACLKRYEAEVKSYTLSFRKRERIAKQLHPWESIEVCYQEKPHSVFFDWQEGARSGGPMKALYVEGKNENSKGKSQVLALPAPPLTALGIQKRDPDSPDSKSSGRYPLNQFGIKQAMQRVLNAWRAADAEKALHVEYLGLHKVPEADNRICHKIRRHKFARPEGDDGMTEVIIYVDRETLFQVGTIVRGAGGELLGEYYFRNIKLNPKFAASQFDPKEVLRK